MVTGQVAIVQSLAAIWSYMGTEVLFRLVTPCHIYQAHAGDEAVMVAAWASLGFDAS